MDNLSFNTRKSLCNHLGDLAGRELADFLLQLKGRLDRLERTKVDRMPVVPESPWPDSGAELPSAILRSLGDAPHWSD